MNVTVLAKDDEALLVRINKGGVVVSANIGDISDMGDKSDHFNTIEGQWRDLPPGQHGQGLGYLLEHRLRL